MIAVEETLCFWYIFENILNISLKIAGLVTEDYSYCSSYLAWFLREPFVKRFTLYDRFILCYRTIVLSYLFYPVWLSVTLVYCGQMVEWIKMKLGMGLGLSPETWHGIRPQSRPPKKGHSPQFSAHVYCGQTAGRIKMPLGTEVGLSPGNFVFDRDPGLHPKKGHSLPIFGLCLLWPNGSPSQLLLNSCWSCFKT